MRHLQRRWRPNYRKWQVFWLQGLQGQGQVVHALWIDIPLGQDNEDRGFGKVFEYDRSSERVNPVEHRSVILKFPRGEEQWEVEQAPADLLSQFPNRENRRYSSVTVHLREKPVVIGYGMPFANSSAPELEDWYNNNLPCVGGITFRDFVEQTTFHLLVAKPEMIVEQSFDHVWLGEPFSHSYGTSLEWDVDRLAQLWHRTPRTRVYNPTFQFEDDGTMLAVSSQITVQDDLWVELEARKLREREKRVYFIPHATEARAYYAIMPRGTAFVDEFRTAWDRLLSNPLEIFFWRMNPDRVALNENSPPTEKLGRASDDGEYEEPSASWTAEVMFWPGTISELSGHPRGDTDLVMKVWRPRDETAELEIATFLSRQEADKELGR
ncbi:hypothetical protein LX36DRAFT_344715 [Colletotrichum falcatum]|nr:hypothetical protein LX36DRAFT_344715 [Colletotrichum falcatum]